MFYYCKSAQFSLGIGGNLSLRTAKKKRAGSIGKKEIYFSGEFNKEKVFVNDRKIAKEVENSNIKTFIKKKITLDNQKKESTNAIFQNNTLLIKQEKKAIKENVFYSFLINVFDATNNNYINNKVISKKTISPLEYAKCLVIYNIINYNNVPKKTLKNKLNKFQQFYEKLLVYYEISPFILLKYQRNEAIVGKNNRFIYAPDLCVMFMVDFLPLKKIFQYYYFFKKECKISLTLTNGFFGFIFSVNINKLFNNLSVKTVKDATILYDCKIGFVIHYGPFIIIIMLTSKGIELEIRLVYEVINSQKVNKVKNYSAQKLIRL